jgi:dynein heavy chain
MSVNLQTISNDILNGKTPQCWKLKSYPTLKPLGGYIIDLIARLKYLQVRV